MIPLSLRDLLTPGRLLLALAAASLAAGIVLALGGRPGVAGWIWAAGILPVLVSLVVASLRDLWRGETGVDILAALSMAGALLLGEYLAGIVVALMYAGGTVLEEYAQRRARHELSALLGRAPRQAHRERDGVLEDIAAGEVCPGDLLVVRSGEMVPVDGRLADEVALLDESALTGEPLPARHAAGASLRSGSLNAGQPFRLEATATAAASTYAGIVRLVEAAQAGKAPFQRLADRYALMFLPVALVLAGGAWLLSGDPARALAVLVVATPCPLILAAPVAIVAGVSAAARRGILVKGGGPLEALAGAGTLVLDKTGTLTTGRARLLRIESRGGMGSDALLGIAASLDQLSGHPMAAAILEAARERGVASPPAEAASETPGAGMSGYVDGRPVRLGGLGFVAAGGSPDSWARDTARSADREGLSAVFVAIDGEIEGALLMADEIRAESPRAIRALRRAGIGRIVMLSGDRRDVAEAVAGALGVDTVLAERSPADKVDAVRAERGEAATVMVGDGVNDAPALAAADIGVAMGARGAAAASEAADLVLLVDRLDRLGEAIAIAGRTRRIALQSVLAGMALSGMGMVAAALGWLPPVAGALVQEAIDVAVILNALRALGDGRAHTALLAPARVRELAQEHADLAPLLERMRRAADRLGVGDGAALTSELEALDGALRERVLPHERVDETRLHPGLATMLGGRDPMAAISRGHREIVHLARRFHRQVAGLPAGGPAAEDLAELRRSLYALEAILRLHFAQEDEIYDSIAAEAGASAGGRSGRGAHQGPAGVPATPVTAEPGKDRPLA